MTAFQLNRDKPLFNQQYRSSLEKIGQHWFKIVLAIFALHIIFNKDVNIQVNFSDKNHEEISDISEVQKMPASFGGMATAAAPILTNNKPKPKVNLSAIAGLSTRKVAKKIAPKEVERVATNHKLKASQFNNLSFILNRNYASKKGVPYKIVDEKMEICRQYVERFARVAIAEQERFGIPASITLAQGLLETDAGASRLVNESKNHFGIKCRKKCKDCTCRNYKDDDEFDMFRVFNSDWESYREHSNLLSTRRYVHLKNLSQKDYKGWAKGLKKAGYATDENYAKKLVRIIETLDLYQFDA
ncbi:MAG: flagellum-specific peptidoglycan hydrolase FlgJ [Saprospiraceae bacterium]|jgi:flagellum-specific peptidoglycan hydrolase FlgJ